MIPWSGQVSMSMINTEINKYGTYAYFWLNHADARALAGRPSGTIAFSDFRGKSSFSGYAIGGDDSGVATGSGYTARAYAEAFPTGGSGTYTYKWYVVSGGALNDDTLKRPSISQQVRYGGSRTTQCYCVVTDSNGAQFTTNTVTLTINYTYNEPGNALPY